MISQKIVDFLYCFKIFCYLQSWFNSLYFIIREKMLLYYVSSYFLENLHLVFKEEELDMRNFRFISTLLSVIFIFSASPFQLVNAASSETVYYVSSSIGSDSNSGLSPQTPFKTISKINSLSLESGTKVLFKCGDIWRGETLLLRYSGISYGSYGEGEKPAFYGSERNYADPALWKPSGTKDVYVSTFTLQEDIGAIVFDYDNSVGMRHINASALTDLYLDNMFFYSSTDKHIYIYSLSGNPGECHQNMEFIMGGCLISNCDTSNISIDNITLKYCNYGLAGPNGSNFTITNMYIAYIGGKFSGNVRAGNGIEFYGSSRNITVENCVITQCYDTAFTCQKTGQNEYIENIVLRNNEFSYCHWTMEFWIEPVTSAYSNHMTGVVIENNRFLYSGFGFGSALRYTIGETNKSTCFTAFIFQKYSELDFILKNNIFYGAKDYVYYLGWGDYTPEFSGNSYNLSYGAKLGCVGDKMFTNIPSFDKNASLQYVPVNNYNVNTTLGSGETYTNDYSSLKIGKKYRMSYMVEADFSTDISRNATISIAKVSSKKLKLDTAVYKDKINYLYYDFTANSANASITLKNTDGGGDIYIYSSKLLPFISISKKATVFGSINCDKSSSVQSENLIFSVSPDSGFKVDDEAVGYYENGSDTFVKAEKLYENTYCIVLPENDIFLTAKFLPDEYFNLVKDSNFDIKGEDWNYLWSTQNIPYTNSNSNRDYAAEIMNYGGGVYQTVSFKKNHNYKLSFDWAPCSTSGTPSKMRVTVTGDSQKVYFDKYVSSTDFDFINETFYFDVDTTENAILRFDRSDCDSATVMIDNVNLSRSSNNAAITEKVNVLGDSDFSKTASSSDWQYLFGTSQVGADASFGTQGNLCASIPPWQGGVYQTFDLEQGKECELSFLWSAGAYGGAKSDLVVSVFNDNETVLSQTLSSYNYYFEKATFTFVPNYSGKYSIRFDRSTCGSFTVHLDDVYIYTTAKPVINDAYTLENNLIIGVLPKTNTEEFLKKSDFVNIDVFAEDCENIYTGYKVALCNYQNRTAEGYAYAVVSGDVNGDGLINILDLISMKKYLAGIKSLSSAQIKAGCLTETNDISAQDVIAIVKFLLNQT